MQGAPITRHGSPMPSTGSPQQGTWTLRFQKVVHQAIHRAGAPAAAGRGWPSVPPGSTDLDPGSIGLHRGRGSYSCSCHHTSLTFFSLCIFFRPLKADFSGIVGDLLAVGHSFLVSKEFSRYLRNSYQRVNDQRLVVAGFWPLPSWPIGH